MTFEYLTPHTMPPAIEDHIRKDPFANFLGATIEAIEPGYSRVSLTVSESMLNFHGMTHGGLVFALGDIAFAAASNSHGQTALALNVAISFLRPTKIGDHLVAEAKEVHLGGATALYDIVVTEQNSGQSIAKSQATVYRKRATFI
ncbi:MAG: hotdog fold thioesterase [Desulfobulbus sp.]|nr:hotdog fold thioesterase [Desulfobulbus sp.]